jgi:hypothetical protein
MQVGPSGTVQANGVQSPAKDRLIESMAANFQTALKRGGLLREFNGVRTLRGAERSARTMPERDKKAPWRASLSALSSSQGLV